MRSFILACLVFIAPAFAGDDPSLDIDPERVTVSGISSGGHMATQLHIAYSDLFSGVAVLSGGPFNCAGNSLVTALKLCTTNTEDPLPIADLASGIRAAAAAKLDGIVIEAGGVMVLDMDETVKSADDLGLFIWVRKP